MENELLKAIIELVVVGHVIGGAIMLGAYLFEGKKGDWQPARKGEF